MEPKTTLEIVTDICVEQLGVEPSAVKPESKLVDDLGADSLDTVELVMAFEEELSLEKIQDEDAEKVVTVADAVTLLDRLVAEKARRA